MATDILRPRSIDEHPLKRRIYRVPTPSVGFPSMCHF